MKSVENDVVDLRDVDYSSILREHGPKNLRNFEEFSEGACRVKVKLTGLVGPSRITFCLGGDCAFVPGSLAGLKNVYKGKPAMVWLDEIGRASCRERV